MCRISNLLNFRQGVITKSLVAGVFACAVAPGSVFATATYDAGAFVEFTSIDADDGLVVELEIDDSTVTQNAEGDASVDAAISEPVLGTTAFTSQTVMVTGEASSPASGSSLSDASARNISSISVENTTDDILDLVVAFTWAWDAIVTLDLPLLETAGASVSILMETVLGETIIDQAFDLVAAGEGMDLNTGLFTLSVPGGGVDGIQTVLFAEGIAIAVADDAPIPGVPVPATLALMCIGLISLASRKRTRVLSA